jgi:hypothetical protein
MILQLLNDLEVERHYRLPLLRELGERLREHSALEGGAFLETVRAVVASGVAVIRETHTNALLEFEKLMELRDDPDGFVVAVRAARVTLGKGIEREETEVFRALEVRVEDRDLERLGERMRQMPELGGATESASFRPSSRSFS